RAARLRRSAACLPTRRCRVRGKRRHRLESELRLRRNAVDSVGRPPHGAVRALAPLTVALPDLRPRPWTGWMGAEAELTGFLPRPRDRKRPGAAPKDGAPPGTCGAPRPAS